ncbi:MAG: glycosyltransferase family 2 protein [Acidobacteria bacterium]|nr:glycosyltransferase family 2 protein [Acidobacteriota bacterium]
MKISATIITLNEEESLPRALASISFCDEVVVVDSGSSDRTCEIAQQSGARVLERDWTGYADQKNFAAQAAAHDWILALDADEEVAPDLRASIETLQTAGPEYAGYRFARLARYLGRWIHHSGWYPDAKIRLYDRRRGRWFGDYVHESVKVEGSVGTLAGDLLHYTCDSLDDHRQRVDRYTDLAARELIENRRRVGLGQLLVSPPWAFLRSYVMQQGFRDGPEGLLIARMAASYTYSKYAKARALQT